MTVDDRLVSGASSESSLPPNKSSGDIVERLLDRSDHYLPDWADAAMKEAAAEIERLRREVEEANRFWNERCVQTSVNAHGWMQAHDQLLGFIQSRPDLLKVMMAEKFEIKYPAPADTPTLLQRAITAESAAEIERLRREAEELPILRDAVCRIHNREWADGDPVAHISHAAAMWKIADDTLREIGKPGATSTNEVKRLQVLVSQSEAERYKSCGELLNRALTAESAVAAAWEEAARVAKDRWREWRSSYEDDLDGMDACEDISKAISARASALRAAVSKKTAESGHSPSTHNSESE